MILDLARFTLLAVFERNGLVLFITLVMGDERMVLALLNAASPGFLALVALALTLLATSIGLVQVAGSETTRPFLGPDVHLNFLLIVLVPRPNTELTASSMGSTS